MEELQGFVILAELGRTKLDVSLIASSPKAALTRACVTLVLSRRDIRWMDATYTILETVGLKEFKAGRDAGTR